MPDFFEKEETPTDEVVETPETIKVGDNEYAQEDLESLITMGKLGREVEEKQNTSLDKVYSAYSKTTNELKALRDEYEGFKNAAPAPINTEDEDSVRQAKEAAKKLGLVTNDDFESYLDKSFRSKYQQERAAERLLESASSLENKYNGQDGRPKFSTDSILEYMRDTGINDPEKAYKLQYENELDKWKEGQLEKSKKTGFYTEEGTGATTKTPKDIKVTGDNISRLMAEALQGN